VEFTRLAHVISFAEDIIILTKRESNVEAKSYMNLELRKITVWAQRTN